MSDWLPKAPPENELEENEWGYIVLTRYVYANLDDITKLDSTGVITANCGHRCFVTIEMQMFMTTPRGFGCYSLCTDCMTWEKLHELADKHGKSCFAVPGYQHSLNALSPEERELTIEWARDHGIQEVQNE